MYVFVQDNHRHLYHAPTQSLLQNFWVKVNTFNTFKFTSQSLVAP